MNNNLYCALSKHKEAIKEIHDELYNEFANYVTMDDADALMVYKIFDDFLN